jgi:hypothetical protein
MQSYAWDEPSRPIVLWGVEAPTFQPYAPAGRPHFTSKEISGTHFCQRLRTLKIVGVNDLSTSVPKDDASSCHRNSEDRSRNISCFYFQVKAWITFNEPDTFTGGYGSSEYAPAVHAPGIGEYLATRTVLLSHARVYHLYQADFQKLQQGLCSYPLGP